MHKKKNTTADRWILNESISSKAAYTTRTAVLVVVMLLFFVDVVVVVGVVVFPHDTAVPIHPVYRTTLTLSVLGEAPLSWSSHALCNHTTLFRR